MKQSELSIDKKKDNNYRKNVAINDLLYIKENKKNITLYGAGRRGLQILRYLRRCGFTEFRFIDKNKTGSLLDGVHVYNLNEIDENDYIIITPEDRLIQDEIIRELANVGRTGYFFDAALNLFGLLTECFGESNDSIDLNENEIRARGMFKGGERIHVFTAWASRIGELIYRSEVIFKEQEIEQKSSYIVVPNLGRENRISNERLLNVISRYIRIITRREADFWKYMFLMHASRLDLRNIDKYDLYQSKYSVAKMTKQDFPTIEFDCDELEEIDKKFERINVSNPYVCIFERDLGYLLDVNKNVNKEWYKHRNANIEEFNVLVEYLKCRNIDVIRVGQITDKPYKREGVVDFASCFYDELIDLHLNKNCYMWIGGPSGAGFLPRMFNSNSVYINLDVLLWATFCCRFSKNEVYSCKLYYIKSQKRFMNVFEMMMLNFFDIEPHNYTKKYGIEIVNNDGEDILNVFKEAESRFKGKWSEDRVGEELQKRYKGYKEKFLNKYGEMQYMVNYPWKVKDCITPIDISSLFLKRHPYLVEEPDTYFF